MALARLRSSGLSPRARGNLASACSTNWANGSIPACAGEPASAAARIRASGVYPRVRGGTAVRKNDTLVANGLSPRARGNHWRVYPADLDTGSIPACAGEPRCGRTILWSPTVYPRVRGGTAGPGGRAPEGWGLSPRARGNQAFSMPRPGFFRSIPACAGEPWRKAMFLIMMRVYPRVRGGTWGRTTGFSCREGLSPRARGNPFQAWLASRNMGSIPACAGEPVSRHNFRRRNPVYPRVRGGTVIPWSIRTLITGLSPRARGNLQRDSAQPGSKRSIPACAGEPDRRVALHPPIRVYPRVRGGTAVPGGVTAGTRGLSPRARGNQGCC